jgi:hypothetical protein
MLAMDGEPHAQAGGLPPEEPGGAAEEELGPYQAPPRRVRGAPARARRREARRGPLPSALAVLVRLLASCGIIGIGIGIAAVMRSQHSQGWLVGLVVAAVAVVLSALLWSRRL